MPPRGPSGASWRYHRALGVPLLLVCIAALLVSCAPGATASAAIPRPVSRPSPGCAADTAAATLGPLAVAGERRDVVARVPGGSGTVPRDLVIAFHGRTNDASQARRYFDLDAALPEAVIVVSARAARRPGRRVSRGRAALVLHHPDDRLVPLADGERARDALRAANGLDAAPAVPVADPALGRLQCIRHGDDDAPYPVVWCHHDDARGPGGRYYPHTWPGGVAAAIAGIFASLPWAGHLP